jgi:hypothetical protein
MKQYTVTAEFTVHAHNAADAERKVHALIFNRTPIAPAELPHGPVLGVEVDAACTGQEQPELPWAPTGPGCTALL